MKFDSLDLKIVRILQRDARRKFVDIARELNVQVGTVQARFKKMKNAGLITGSTLIIDPDKIGIRFYAIMAINAIENRIKEVAKYLDELRFEKILIESYVVDGTYNIFSFLSMSNSDEIFKIMRLVRAHPAVIDVSIDVMDASRAREDAIFKEVDIEGIFKE